MNEPYERVGLHPTTDTMYGGELYHLILITFESDFRGDWVYFFGNREIVIHEVKKEDSSGS